MVGSGHVRGKATRFGSFEYNNSPDEGGSVQVLV